jgi:hypothetical protein
MGRRKEVKPFELGSKETSMFSNRNWQAAACWTRGGGEKDFRERIRKPRVSEKEL